MSSGVNMLTNRLQIIDTIKAEFLELIFFEKKYDKISAVNI